MWTQLSQEHDGMEFPISPLLHTFTETQRKWSTTKQEAYRVYYAVTKWNYYLQGADIIVQNDHKPLAKFLNGKNTNNKVNRWGLELATYKKHSNGFQELRIRQLIDSFMLGDCYNKHVMDSGQKFLALVIPKSWKYTVLIEAHDKLGHQGNTHTYCLIK